MSKYQNLLKYKNYFENITIDKVCCWGGGEKNSDGVLTIPYPIYDRKLIEFIDEAYKTDLIDHNYLQTIESKKSLPSKEPIDFIADCDFELLKATLTFYIRGERFCSGFWVSVVKKKVFYKILVRLAELESK